MSTLRQELTSRYGMGGADRLLEDKDFGMANGHSTADAFHSNPISFRGLDAPAYASSNFSVDACCRGSKSAAPSPLLKGGVLWSLN